MPFNSVTETNKGVTKPRFSFSLKRNNASNFNDENKILLAHGDSKENAKQFKGTNVDNKENRPLKRPLKSVYFNTLNASKKLKTISENSVSKVTDPDWEPELNIIGAPKAGLSGGAAMLNGHHQNDNKYEGNAAAKKLPIGTLSNLGNTCFLNSVLYTLRYAPRFLHNLHHLVSDLASVEQKLGSIRLKSSSLGRSASGLASSGTRSWSSKDLLSLGQSDSSNGKTKIQIATERLHETYSSLRSSETKSLHSDSPPDPFAADAFLCALREVNSTFEGNRQQDAHELLICILNNIRETCRALSARSARLQLSEQHDSNGIARQPSLDGDSSKPMLGNVRKSWKKRKDVKEKRASPTEERAPSPPEADKEERKPGWDFVAEDFEGTMVMRTTCVECETVRELRQPAADVCVPVPDERDKEPIHAAATTTEYLRDQNKYWCGVCLRYVEARRSVGYLRLPRLLVLQLKRFSGGMQKITRHAHTPIHMDCFCETCAKREQDQPPLHRYSLWAVIMHLGQSLSGGHYVAYARDGPGDGGCGRAAAAPPPPSLMRTLFSRPRAAPGCSAKDCCVPRDTTPAWLACDDELVKPISDDEFEDLLSPEPKARTAATPYLLFYAKNEVG